jgi:hypothetical protein
MRVVTGTNPPFLAKSITKSPRLVRESAVAWPGAEALESTGEKASGFKKLIYFGRGQLARKVCNASAALESRAIVRVFALPTSKKTWA